jgi:hypothetical protein
VQVACRGRALLWPAGSTLGLFLYQARGAIGRLSAIAADNEADAVMCDALSRGDQVTFEKELAASGAFSQATKAAWAAGQRMADGSRRCGAPRPDRLVHRHEGDWNSRYGASGALAGDPRLGAAIVNGCRAFFGYP